MGQCREYESNVASAISFPHAVLLVQMQCTSGTDRRRRVILHTSGLHYAQNMSYPAAVVILNFYKMQETATPHIYDGTEVTTGATQYYYSQIIIGLLLVGTAV